MHFIDTHIHLQDFNDDFALKVLRCDYLRKMVLIASREEDYEKIGKYLDEYANKIIGAFGIHPWYANLDFNEEKLIKCLKKYPNALVGEIGLDGIKNKVSDEQRELFRRELEIAKNFSRPVIIHGAKAFGELALYEKELKSVKFVYHGFTKNMELIKFINKCGGYFGLGAMFLRQKDAKSMIENMPKNKILFETDAPYQVREENYFFEVKENMEKLSYLLGVFGVKFDDLFIENAEEFIRC